MEVCNDNNIKSALPWNFKMASPKNGFIFLLLPSEQCVLNNTWDVLVCALLKTIWTES